MDRVLVPLLILGLAACAPKVEIDENELEGVGAKVAEFDPANKIIPFPNNLLFGETGLLAIPAGCHESEAATALRSSLLNDIDGFAMMNAPLYATFSEEVDVGSVAAHTKLYNMSDGSTIDLAPIADTTLRWNVECDMQNVVDRLLLIPVEPLQEDTYYSVVMEYGVTGTSGDAFRPSAAWGFVRQDRNPVQIETNVDADGNSVVSVTKNNTPFSPADEAGLTSILGIDLLWNAHKEVMSFAETVGHDRKDVILAWGFKTQSASVLLDGNVEGSPAHMAVSQTGTMSIHSEINDPAGIEAHLLGELEEYWSVWARDPNNYGTDKRYESNETGGSMPWVCDGDESDPYSMTAPCSAIGAILHGTYRSPKFQNSEVLNLWMPAMEPGLQEYLDIEMVAFVPAGEAPANGWPTIFWGHGIGDSKEQAYMDAAIFNEAGFAVVSTDWVSSGVRATQVKVTADCPAGLTRPPADGDACFTSPIDGNPGTTRDNIRQSVIDAHAFVHALRNGCSAANGGCGNLAVDPDNLAFIGHSLGGFVGQPMLGTTTTPFKAVVLSVTGIGWRDAAERMTNVKWGCFFVNALIDLGVIDGEHWDGNDDVTAFCIQEVWQEDASYKQLATPFFWLMDSAEPGVFTRAMGEKHPNILIQETVDDATVDNWVTRRMAGLLGITAQDAHGGDDVQPSDGIDANRVFLEYHSERGVKEYTHATVKMPEPYASCLWPTATLGCSESELASIHAGKLATRQMQADLIQYLTNQLTSAE